MAIFGRTPKFYGQLDKILTEKNKSAIIKSSEDRKDGMFVNPLNHPSNQCHKNCLYEYTSKEKIKRYLTKRKNLDEAGTLRPRKSQRLSNVVTFEFETKCFFCGGTCNIEKPKHCKNPNRWKKGMLCQTADRGKSKEGITRLSFKEVLLQVSHHFLDLFILMRSHDHLHCNVYWWVFNL